MAIKSSDMKIKKKRWIEIISPLFNEKVLGETHVFDREKALGKHLRCNLMTVLGDPRKQNIDILFKTTKQKGDTAVIADTIGYEIQRPSLRKLVRRGKTKIEDSFKCYTADKKPIVMKPFIITRFIVNNSLASNIRKTVKKDSIEKVSKMKMDDLITELVQGRFQRDRVLNIKKLYPLKTLEYQVVKIVPEKGKFEKPEQKEKPIKKEEETENKNTKK